MIGSASIAGLPVAELFIGLVTGATYGLLAVGLVLVYRSTRIINFAHGEIGAFAAAVLGVLVLNLKVPYWIAFAIALCVGGGTGALTEVAVVRRLRRVPRVMSVVATLGAAALLLGFESVISAQARTGLTYPQPAGLPSFRLGGVYITPAYTAMLIFSPVAVMALTLFLRRSRYGLGIRAAAANPDAARLAAVSVSRMSALTWTIAGTLSALTAVFIFPTEGFLSSEAFGPSLMLRALTAAVIARMDSLPVALGAGLVVGEVETISGSYTSGGGPVDAILFVVIVIALLLQPGVAGRRVEQGSWTSLQGFRPVPEAWRRVWTVRSAGPTVAFVAVALAVVLQPVIGSAASFKLSTTFAIAIVGLSAFIVTGLSGQLSLGQFALAGVGGWIGYLVAHASGNFVVAVFAGGAAAALASTVVGLPGLRIRGLMLAVTTLAFALAVSSWLLQQPWALGSGVVPGTPVVAGAQLGDSKSYYWFALAFLVLATWIAVNVRRGGLGRLFVALRDNEDAARAFTVNAWGRKLQAFALAGFLAGVGGAVYAFALPSEGASTFLPSLSIDVMAMAVIGGLGIVAGPIIGAFYIFALPAFVPLDAVTTTASAGGWLLLILYFPGGIAGMLAPLRERGLRMLVRLAGRDPDGLISAAAAAELPAADAVRAVATSSLLEPVAAVTPIANDAMPLLEITGLTKSYGGVRAVDGVDLEVRDGEVLGLIGPNGAGKTTLFELIAGFATPDGGEVLYQGRRLRSPAFMRARQGVVRSFQDPRLFPTMTVLESVMLAQECTAATTLMASALGSRVAEGPKRERAAELVAALGLSRWMHAQTGELSTGTRRIAELCCLLAMSPRLLLLDEPSSGIAQAETEALAGLVLRIKEHLGATVVIIEHDIPLVMGVSDRVAAMESGRVIRVGTPDEVRNDPQVIESYLGGDPAAIERSGARSAVQ